MSRVSHPVLNRKFRSRVERDALCGWPPLTSVSLSPGPYLNPGGTSRLRFLAAWPSLSPAWREADGGCGDARVWCDVSRWERRVVWCGHMGVDARRGRQCWVVIGFGAGGCDGQRARDKRSLWRTETHWPSVCSFVMLSFFLPFSLNFNLF